MSDYTNYCEEIEELNFSDTEEVEDTKATTTDSRVTLTSISANSAAAGEQLLNTKLAIAINPDHFGADPALFESDLDPESETEEDGVVKKDKLYEKSVLRVNERKQNIESRDTGIDDCTTGPGDETEAREWNSVTSDTEHDDGQLRRTFRSDYEMKIEEIINGTDNPAPIFMKFVSTVISAFGGERETKGVCVMLGITEREFFDFHINKEDAMTFVMDIYPTYSRSDYPEHFFKYKRGMINPLKFLVENRLSRSWTKEDTLLFLNSVYLQLGYIYYDPKDVINNVMIVERFCAAIRAPDTLIDECRTMAHDIYEIWKADRLNVGIA